MGRLKDDSRRWSIVESAFRVFGERGFRSTTMKHIAQAAGIAPGSIYTYFRDKDDLFRTAVEEGWKEFLSEFQGVVQSQRPLEERIEALLDMGFAKLKEGLPLLRGMLFEASRMQAFHSNLDSFCEHVVTLLEEGRRRGLLDFGSGDAWKRLVKVVVNGVLFSVSLASREATESETTELKAAVKGLIKERIRRERPA